MSIEVKISATMLTKGEHLFTAVEALKEAVEGTSPKDAQFSELRIHKDGEDGSKEQMTITSKDNIEIVFTKSKR